MINKKSENKEIDQVSLLQLFVKEVFKIIKESQMVTKNIINLICNTFLKKIFKNRIAQTKATILGQMVIWFSNFKKRYTFGFFSQ